MVNSCMICGKRTLFYIWTSSRYFPRELIFKKFHLKRKSDKKPIYEGKIVCFQCLEKLKKI